MTLPPEVPSPPPRRPAARARPSGLALVLTGVGGVAVALALFFTVVKVMGTKAISTSTVTAATFDVGSAPQRAAAIARDRTPLLFQDPLGDGGELYVQRVSDRWMAFNARAPGAPTRCILRWEVGPQNFVDPCSGATFPADGTGLVTYPTKVDKGHLLVDLRSPQPPIPQPPAPADQPLG